MLRAWPWFALAAGIVVADQVAKWLIQAWFAPGERLGLTGFLNLVLVFNRGAAFSFLASAPGWQTPLLAGIALLAAAVVSVLLLRNPSRNLFNGRLSLLPPRAPRNLIAPPALPP